ncbi:MAG: hypothetical protein H7246_15130, partial [Phycisphaerae bacterium]|nr:hypothetical protein [Saprospiraceae bacterium]
MTNNPHLSKINPLLEELRQSILAADQQPIEEALRNTLQRLNRQILMPSGPESSIWAWLYGNPTSTEWKQVNHYFEGVDIQVLPDVSAEFDLPNAAGRLCWGVNWTSTDFDLLSAKPNTAGLFFVTKDALSKVPAILDHLSLCSALLPVMTVVSDLNWSEHFEERQRLSAALVRTETWEESDTHTLLQDMTALGDPRVEELLQAINVGGSLERGSAFAQQIIQQAEFNLKVKRQQAQQEDAAHRSRGSLQNAASGNELRNSLQFRLEQHERRQMEGIEVVLSANPNGACFKNLEMALEQMPPLDEEKRAKNIAFIIPDSFK